MIHATQEIYGNLSFKPDINPISRALGRASSVDELSKDVKGKLSRERIAKRAEQQLQSECSFKPRINKYPLPHASQSAIGNQPKTVWDESPFYSDNLSCPVDSYAVDKDVNGAFPRSYINISDPDKMAYDIRQREVEKEECRRSAIIEREIGN